MTNSVTFPTSLGGDGSTVTDDDNASTGLGNGGHRTRFVPAMGQVVAVANVLTQRLSEQSDTSSTSVAIATGSKTFVTAGFYEWAVGMWVTVTSAANPANFMFGQVTSWTTATNTVIIDVDSVGGSGTYSDWTIALSAYSSIGDYLTDADIGVTVQPYDADTPTVASTKAEMQAGTETAIRSMSPLRVAEAISGLVSGRNKIINGAMMIDQRNAGAAVTVETYITDRWRVWQNQSYSIQQSTDAPLGFSNSLAVTKTSTVQSLYAYLVQYIEGFNFSDMLFGTASATTSALSFWVKSSVTGTFSVGLINSAENRAYSATYTINAANTWEQKTITIPGDTSGTWVGATNGKGVGVWFNFGSSGGGGTNTANAWVNSAVNPATGGTANLGTINGATFYITGVQLEKGATATPFENRLYGTELALCQRYYQKMAGLLVPGYVGTAAGTYYSGSTSFLVEMRATPTLSLSGFVNNNSGNAVASGVSNKCFRFFAANTAAGNAYSLFDMETTGAEL